MANTTTQNLSRLYLASTVTFGGSCLAYFILGRPLLIGIDDANITQVYARNIADGYGYVYTPGFERVEGSTSILWTVLNAVAFSVSAHPEAILLGVCFLLTTGAIYFSLSILNLLFRCAGSDPTNASEVFSFLLLGLFGFYTWNVLSLSEMALWSFLLSGFILLILRRIECGAGRVGRRVLILLLPILMGLARPEAMALVPALIAIGAAGEWKLAPWPKATLRDYGLGLLAFVLTTGGLVLARISYFGVPFPNTYYAKVSENPFDNLVHGLSYFAKLIAFGPYAGVLVLAVVGCCIIAVWQAYFTDASGGTLRFHRCLFVISSAIPLVLALPLATGGDHFGSFRLYQPIYPMFFVLAFVGLVLVLRKTRILEGLPKYYRAFLLAAVWVVYFATMATDFYVKSEIRENFEIAKKGRALGDVLNLLVAQAPQTRVAVIAAGGVALTYKGRIVDLMGLNWFRMAHATGIRSGPHGHSAFEASVFWEEKPELVLPRLSKALPETFSVPKYDSAFLDGLPQTTRFRNNYAPVAIQLSETYVVAYARRDWVETHARILRIHMLD